MIQLKKSKLTKNKELFTPEKSHLSIQFSLDGFSFCILNKENNTFTALGDYGIKEFNSTPEKLLSNILSIYKEEPMLSKKYDSVNICHINELSTLVPKPLFDENKLRDYVKFNNKIFSFDYLVYDEIRNHEIINIFIPYVNINNYMLDQYGGFEYKHYSSILLENLMGIYKYSLVPHMFAHISDNHFEILVFANKKLQLYNTFNYTTKEDFIYYLLFAAEQLKLNPEKFELILLGNVEKDDALYSIAYKYVRNVSLIENRSKYKFDEVFTEGDKRSYFTLFNQF